MGFYFCAFPPFPPFLLVQSVALYQTCFSSVQRAHMFGWLRLGNEMTESAAV